jgi:transcriptional regulator of acetoin/glycerol metabolism
MHELVRNKNKYTIARLSKNRVFATPQFSSDILPLASEGELDKAVWRQFVDNKKTDQEYIKESVNESWERCLQMGVDPGRKKCTDFREEKTIDAEHRFLRDVVKNTTSDFSAFLKENGLLFTICDQYGYLTGTVGSYQTLRQADSIHFGPGASWTEQSVGTNAIGTALASGLPQLVTGAEHFCESQHGWICSAAPIFGVNGVLQGCVDISGPIQSNHRRSLALTVYYARAIEALLFQQQCMGMIGQVLNKNAIGLLTLDRYGKICYCNNIAADLFGGSLHSLSGKDVSRWFDLSPFFGQKLGVHWSDLDAMVELRCLHNPTWNIFAAPLINNFQQLHGLTLCVYPPPPAPPQKHNPRHNEHDTFAAMIGGSASFQKVMKTARRVAATNTTVLITGPSGTGKEVMAHGLHQSSPRAKKPFVAVNCGAIAADLIQSELFGYVEGAFTGAVKGGQQGKFEQAAGGTIFLDEIGEMPLAIQVNLLRVLDEKQIVRVGGKQPIPVDVRVIAATNRDMEAMVKEGGFRSDLYYRLHVVPLTLPPLCEREDDVQLLADHFIREFEQTFGRQVDGVDSEFRQALAAYSWPGNIRELRHVIESTMILMDGDTLRFESLPEKIQQASRQPQLPDKDQPRHFVSLNLDNIQKLALKQALEQYEGNISLIAQALGIGRNTTYAKLKKYKLL